MNWQDQEKKECPFCRTDATVSVNRDTLKSVFSGCLCGKFIIDQIALEDAGEYNKILKTDENKILFSGYLRNNQTITVTEEFISEELKGILDYCQGIPFDKKIYEVKRYIYQETTTLGKHVLIEVRKLFTLFYLRDFKELYSIFRHLQENNTLHKSTNVGGATADVVLTFEGFSEIERNVKQSQSEADKKTKKNAPRKARKNVQKTQEKAQTQKVTDEEKSSIEEASSKKSENKEFNNYDNVKPIQLIKNLTNKNLAISTVAIDDIEGVSDLFRKTKLTWHVGPPMQTGDLLLIYIPKGIVKAISKYSELSILNGDGLHLIFVAASKSILLGKGLGRNYEVTIHNRIIINNPISKEMLIQNKVLGKWGPVKMNFRSVGQKKQFVDKNIAEELWRLILEINPDLLFDLSKMINQEPSTPVDVEEKSLSFYMVNKAVSDFWTVEDLLGYETYARAIAQPILDGTTKPPLTIAVQAPWGHGKTSLMRMIQKLLEEKNPSNKPEDSNTDRLRFDQLFSYLDEEEKIEK